MDERFADEKKPANSNVSPEELDRLWSEYRSQLSLQSANDNLSSEDRAWLAQYRAEQMKENPWRLEYEARFFAEQEKWEKYYAEQAQEESWRDDQERHHRQPEQEPER